MISPFTGGEVKLCHEQRELTFRKEKFTYVAQFYVCVDTQEQFTTTELDEINIGQVYNQYRAKYGIPFPDEIKGIRELYGLSASKMSEILGLGANQYRLYENGEMPSEAIGKTLKSIMSPTIFLTYVHNAEYQFDPQDFAKICEKLERAGKLVEDKHSVRIYNMVRRSSINGYAQLNQSKVKNIMLYLINKLGGVFNTKMNKLLFYIDFYSYKRRGCGMTGLSYKAIQYGPVPEKWNVLYGSIEDIESEIVSFSSGNSGERLVSQIAPDMTAITPEEQCILDEIICKLGRKSANQLSELSHHENAWLKFKDTSCYIDYTEAFTLKAL